MYMYSKMRRNPPRTAKALWLQGRPCATPSRTCSPPSTTIIPLRQLLEDTTKTVSTRLSPFWKALAVLRSSSSVLLYVHGIYGDYQGLGSLGRSPRLAFTQLRSSVMLSSMLLYLHRNHQAQQGRAEDVWDGHLDFHTAPELIFNSLKSSSRFKGHQHAIFTASGAFT